MSRGSFSGFRSSGTCLFSRTKSADQFLGKTQIYCFFLFFFPSPITLRRPFIESRKKKIRSHCHFTLRVLYYNSGVIKFYK